MVSKFCFIIIADSFLDGDRIRQQPHHIFPNSEFPLFNMARIGQKFHEKSELCFRFCETSCDEYLAIEQIF